MTTTPASLPSAASMVRSSSTMPTDCTPYLAGPTNTRSPGWACPAGTPRANCSRRRGQRQPGAAEHRAHEPVARIRHRSFATVVRHERPPERADGGGHRADGFLRQHQKPLAARTELRHARLRPAVGSGERGQRRGQVRRIPQRDRGRRRDPGRGEAVGVGLPVRGSPGIALLLGLLLRDHRFVRRARRAAQLGRNGVRAVPRVPVAADHFVLERGGLPLRTRGLVLRGHRPPVPVERGAQLHVGVPGDLREHRRAVEEVLRAVRGEDELQAPRPPLRGEDRARERVDLLLLGRDLGVRPLAVRFRQPQLVPAAATPSCAALTCPARSPSSRWIPDAVRCRSATLGSAKASPGRGSGTPAPGATRPPPGDHRDRLVAAAGSPRENPRRRHPSAVPPPAPRRRASDLL